MRFNRKTEYDFDFRLFKYRDTMFWYGLLAVALVAAPFLVEDYFLSQAVFVGIYVIVGAGLMLLSGYCGQISLGHAAFFAVGAYTVTIAEQAGVPFPLALALSAIVAAGVGVIVGVAALRLSGIYLAIATLAFAFIVEEVLQRWESLTNGASGLMVDAITVAGFTVDSESKMYYLVVGSAVIVMFLVINILRSPIGLAMMALRDSETAAESVGISLRGVKLTAFLLSAGLTGIGGAYYAHKILFISPEQFTVFLSIEFIVAIFIGGIGSLHGIVFGAIFVIVLPQGISLLKDYLPAVVAEQSGLQAVAYGLILFGFILLEPEGIYGIWRKVKHFFSWFPLYRKGELRRQKSFAKAESW